SWNAAEMMSWIMADFLGSPTYLTLREGYDTLPRELARRFREGGGHIGLRHSVRGLERTSAEGEPALALEVRGPDGTIVHCLARHVILALPRRSIELLDGGSFPCAQPLFA